MTLTISSGNILRLAFSALELGAISSFGDDSDQAMEAADLYPVALNGILESTDWSFASRVMALPPVDTIDGLVADPALPHVFALPNDVLALRSVGVTGQTRWRLDDTVLRADHGAPLPVRYTRRIENEGAIPSLVQDVIGLRLAQLMAPRWVGSPEKAARIDRRLENSLIMARRADARNASPESYTGEPVLDWVAEATR
ncbi:hypothetical protein [Pararhodobacter sp.]|uniref:hypothetical protein n=1 Tax=Pararhodobacter sp. TaxID=2127056 RepID=UPI002FDD0E72